MAILFFDSDVLLTATEVQKRMNNLKQWQAEIISLQKRVAETQAWLNLVAKLIGPELANQLIGDVLLPTQVGTSNEAIPPSEQNPRRSRIGDEINRFLKTQPNGATSRQIIDHLLQIQEFQEVAQRNSNGNVYSTLSRLVERGELRKIEGSFYPPEIHPNKNRSYEEETDISSKSSASHPSSPASRDAEPLETDVGEDQHASGRDLLTSPDHIGLDLAADPSEVPPPQTKPLFAADPTEVPPPPTKSLFGAD